jgi:signal transduction histidine kinase
MRWRFWLAGYFLIQTVIVVACFLLLRLPLPEPPERYRLTEAVLSVGGSEEPVRLPHLLSSSPDPNKPQLFTLSFERPASGHGKTWSVMVPRFVSGVEIAVNGAVILDSRRDPVANRPDRNTPVIAPIPDALVHDGPNELTIRLYAWGPLTGFLDQVYVGPDHELRPAYDKRVILFLALPIVFSAWQAILAVLLGVMWFKRRNEPAYGVLAVAMALGVAQAFVVTSPTGQSIYAGLNAVLLASSPLEAACVLAFVIAFFGLNWPRYGWVIFVPGLTVAVMGILGGPPLVRSTFLTFGPPTVLVALVIVSIILGHMAVARRDGIAALLGAAVTVVITFAVHDLLSALDVIADRRIQIARLSYSVMLVAIGIGLTWRFAKALNEVDSFASRMVTLVREAEDKLRASLALEEERARAAALAAERNRLMRDLHDGLGGQLVSIVALSERGDWEGERIGEAARAALKDLRLVIDAMDDIDGDLMLALGAWRERTTAQLRSHGLPLEWRVLAPQGMPVHPELRPWHVIQILRLIDEAVTNAVKHAHAKRIVVSIETVGYAREGQRGRITVEDDGCGFAVADQAQPGAPKAARGLTNMRRRAARCGASLEVTSGPGGTKVRLDLPREFPSAELTAG